MKIDYKYYYQVQGQMFVLNLDYCCSFIWSPATSADYPNCLKIHVEKNDEFISDMSVKLQNYVFKLLLPEIVTRKNNICADNRKCRRPCFESIIACDTKHCDIERYHYAYLNIKNAPEGSWSCDNRNANDKKEIGKKLNDLT